MKIGRTEYFFRVRKQKIKDRKEPGIMTKEGDVEEEFECLIGKIETNTKLNQIYDRKVRTMVEMEL